MPKKTGNQKNHAQRLGAFGESLVKSFLLAHADFVSETCYGHPSDLFVEFGNNSLFRVQVKTRTISKDGNWTFPFESYRNKSDIHRTYQNDILAFVFMPQKRILFRVNDTQQKYYKFNDKVLNEDMEIQSLTETLQALSNVPELNDI
jgi:hypothetical protein|tara:strand:+ start:1576 stop:2016 length:441 start_codon:yes stop_codon:yes gene_type:complete